ncbi:MAG TPA: PilZ domain-containing protein [Xanthobacteraceae bacterium]
MSDSADHTNRRSAPRQKSFLRGLIYFNNRRNVLDCLIRDISAGGARLIFSDAVTTPDALELYIPQKEQTLRAQVQWRQGQEVGVAFPQATPAQQGQESGDLAERVQKLETEMAALKRAMKKLRADVEGDVDAA